MIQSITGKSDPVIGLDAIALPAHFSGAAHYILYLIRAILSKNRPFRCIVFCRKQHRHLFEAWLQPEDRLIPLTIENRWQKLNSYESRLPQLLDQFNVQLFHSMHYVTPPKVKQRRQITTFHDLGFVERPADYPLYKRWFFARRFPTYLKRADALISVSGATREAIHKYFPNLAPKTFVVYPGSDHFDMPVGLPSLEAPYILSVNTFEKRKHIPFLIKAFEIFRKQFPDCYRLILVGQRGNDLKNVEHICRKSEFGNDIEILNNVSDRRLKTLYADAALFVSASAYEGFGFTPFEALHAGCPLVLRSNAITSEIFGRQENILDNENPREWADMIQKQLTAPLNKKPLLRAVEKLTWSNAAIQTIKIYETLLERMPVATS